jgi:hypothetical protein
MHLNRIDSTGMPLPASVRHTVLAALLSTGAAWPAAAAPLDALLTAAPERLAPTAYVELGFDRLNRALDFSTSADDPTANAGGATAPPTGGGNYRATQLMGSWQAQDGLWLTAGLAERAISNAVDTFRYRGWQLSGQWRLRQADAAGPALALRLSGWGNEASVTAATTPVHVPGAILDTVTVRRPSDQNLQVDLIGTWALSPALDVNAALGAGVNRLAYAGLSATTTRNGCPYQLSFNGNDIFGELAGPCVDQGGGVIRQFYDRSGDYGVDVAHEIAWRGRFLQAGVNASWRRGDWTLRGGYLLHVVQRDNVDDILARRNDPVHRHNHILSGEAAYRFHPLLSAYLRMQISSNLFFNDIPVTYNTSTSDSFGHRYALFTVGLRGGF